MPLIFINWLYKKYSYAGPTNQVVYPKYLAGDPDLIIGNQSNLNTNCEIYVQRINHKM